MKNIVIIGASAAGDTLARQLRQVNKDCAITLISDESFPCYDKRKLPDLLLGKVKEKEIFISSDDFYLQHNITFVKDCKVSLVNTQKNLVYGKNTEAIPYDFLIISSGRRFVVPQITGAKKTGVFCLNSLSDFQDFRAYASGESVCVVGANRWAREVAARLALTRKEIRLIHADPINCAGSPEPPLVRIEVIQDELVEIIGESQVQAVKLKGGKIIGTSAVLYMEEAKSNIDFLKNSQISLCDDLICVNEHLRTNRENVFACGAVCKSSRQENTLKTWDEVVSQGQFLAQHLLSVLQFLEESR